MEHKNENVLRAQLKAAQELFEDILDHWVQCGLPPDFYGPKINEWLAESRRLNLEG